jgi:hypothetical protein
VFAQLAISEQSAEKLFKKYVPEHRKEVEEVILKAKLQALM